MDETKSLFEHIKNRLPTGYGLGDDGTEYKDNVPNHKTFQQTLREEHEGDVGIFEYVTSEPLSSKKGTYAERCGIQIAVITKNGDIEQAKKYLEEAYNNINNNRKSSKYLVMVCNKSYLTPMGKTSNGLQWVQLAIAITYKQLTD